MIGGFRVERLIATGSMGAVYEATQLSLRRAVALRLIPAGHFTAPEQLARFDHRQRLAAAIHDPNLVAYYEFGEWEGGRFIASRLIRGRTLAELRARRAAPAAASVKPLAGALAAAHAAGLAHGGVSDENILIEPDGTPYLADLGIGEGGSREADRRALDAVVSGLPERAAGARTWGAHAPLALGLLAVAGALSLVLGVALNGGDAEAPLLDSPPSPAKTTVFGSDLPPVAVEPLGCGEDPSPNTPACTFAQTTLDGRALVVPRAGVIRAWAVRGASGDLALQVIRKHDGKSFVVGFSQPERIGDPAPQAFPAEIAVRPGDRIGIRLAPAAVIGAHPRPSSAFVRWEGTLTADLRPPDETTRDVELMLRADIEFGARSAGPRQLLGDQAASAPSGHPLDEASAPQGGRAGRVVVVQLPGGIAIDLFRGGRIARLEVPDADPDGELLELVQSCGPVGSRGFCLRWRNPGEGLALEHAYRVRGNGRLELIG